MDPTLEAIRNVALALIVGLISGWCVSEPLVRRHRSMFAAPLRAISRRDLWRSNSHPRGSYSVTLHLECGHTVYMKYSKAPRHRARCKQCQEGANYERLSKQP